MVIYWLLHAPSRKSSLSRRFKDIQKYIEKPLKESESALLANMNNKTMPCDALILDRCIRCHLSPLLSLIHATPTNLYGDMPRVITADISV